MNPDEVLAELASHGNERYRKTFARHGVRGPCFGVSHVDLGKLKKRIKTDHSFALALWKSRKHDARILATMAAHRTKKAKSAR